MPSPPPLCPRPDRCRRRPATRLAVPLLARALGIVLGIAASCRPDPPPIAVPDDLPPPLWPGSGLAALLHPPGAGAAPDCGAAVRLDAALPDPSDLPDRQGEWVRLAVEEPVPLVLDGWSLASGRRRLRLDGTVVTSGEPVLVGGPEGALGLGSLRLRNGDGEVHLVDPCGRVADSLAWGGEDCAPAEPGRPVVAVTPWRLPDAEIGPARVVPGEALGGCGQT